MSTETIEEQEVETARPKLKRPPMYRVLLLNDDFTPMDFVVDVLQLFFNLNKEKAIATMMQVHQQGKAVCGVYSRDVAEAKVEQVSEYSKQNKQPLLCAMEAC